MLSEKAKKLFADIGMEYAPVAIRFSYVEPEDLERVDETMSLCQFVKKAQTENRAFYMTKDDENCSGKMVLGMIPKEPFGASGGRKSGLCPAK